MQLNTLSPATKNRTARRVGRGGKRGKTSGKGHKGQKARAGHKIRPVERDMIKRIPKLRGHGKNRGRTVNTSRIVPQIVNIDDIERVFAAGDEVNPKTLVAKGLMRRTNGRYPAAKILGVGTLSKKVTVSACTLSATAKAAIEAAGGAIVA
jgi:large subunit ribosomal protein L15